MRNWIQSSNDLQIGERMKTLAFTDDNSPDSRLREIRSVIVFEPVRTHT